MASEFDELEEYIMADMRRTYTDTVIDHAMYPRNVGSMSNADGFGSVTGPCGDTMEIYLKVRDDRIINTSFRTDGCGPSIASGSMVTELVKGRSIIDAQKVKQDDILDALQGKIKIKNLPDNCKMVRCQYNLSYDAWDLLVEHGSFPNIKEGCMYPRQHVEWESTVSKKGRGKRFKVNQDG